MSKTIYALFDPDGAMKKCSDSLDSVTNFMPSGIRHPSFTSKMWNDLFGASTNKRKNVYMQNGWKVLSGKFMETNK